MKLSIKEKKIDHETQVIKSQLGMNPIYAAASTINSLHGKALDLNTLVDELLYTSKRINKNDVEEVEKMLLMQAKTLECVFYDAIKKLVNLNLINQVEVFSNIAFKAQTQSRKTLAVLAELKRPHNTTFINQQNNAVAQQINNKAKNNFEKNKNTTNELLSESDYAPLEPRGTQETIRVDSNMATLEKINRG